MGKKVIIAEKPKLANTIASSIPGSFKRCDGFFENENYIVTWALGHLFQLVELEEYLDDYDEKKKYRWTLDGLPFCPKEFKFELIRNPKTKKPDSGCAKQFKVIKGLCARADVDGVFNAGDADREGEIIVRLILQHAKNKKPVYRLWLPDQTPETILRELKTVKPDKEYDNLANEGFARTYVDWTYGINLTRMCTLKSGSLLRVGRVIVPIVRAIYDRDMAIRNFVPEKYYGLVSKEKTNGFVIELNSKKTFHIDEKAAATKTAELYNGVPAIVSDVKSEEKIIAPPKLFSLSTLQGVLGKKYKMSPSTSLSLIQKLYEAGYVTYPRTNSEYLATAEKEKMSKILSILNEKGYSVAQQDKKSVYDDAKIESHSALTPTYKIPNQSDLSEKEWQVYTTIFNRFIAVFCSIPCKVNRTIISIKVGEYEEFRLKGDVYISKGWQEYDGPDKEDKILPPLQIGDRININFVLDQRETKPPKHYTVETLSNFLKNPFKKEKQISDDIIHDEDREDDTEDYKALFEGVELGTEATRTPIIEKAIQSKYISLKKNAYYIEPDGEFFIETLDKLGVNMNKEKTAELGRVLKNVYKGELSVRDSVDIAKKEIEAIFNSCKGISIAVPLGKCPKCGGNVSKSGSGPFVCENRGNGCQFIIYAKVSGKVLSDADVRMLLQNRRTDLLDGFISKKGKPFSAYLVLSPDGDFAFEFEKNR